MFENMNPTGKTTAVLEILIMLIIAYLLGIFTWWLYQRIVNKRKNKEISDLKEKNNKLEKENKDLKAKFDACEESKKTFRAKEKEFQSKLDQLNKKANELEAASKESKQKLNDNNDVLKEVNKLKTENFKLHNDNEYLHSELKKLQAENTKLRGSVKKFKSKEEAAQKIGFKLVSEDKKEDLTVISGIGKFIESKLNELGIYTIEQISEFEPDTIERVTEAIEFFPGRIQRDAWVEQAKKIVNDRK